MKTKPLTMNPVLFIMGMVSLFTDLSGQMIVPILPLYLTTVLHVQVGTLGVIEGIAESTASLLKLFSGWMTDRVGKRSTKGIIVWFFGHRLSQVLLRYCCLSSF